MVPSASQAATRAATVSLFGGEQVGEFLIGETGLAAEELEKWIGGHGKSVESFWLRVESEEKGVRESYLSNSQLSTLNSQLLQSPKQMPTALAASTSSLSGSTRRSLVDGFLDGHGIHVIGLVADHLAEFAFLGEFHGHDAEAHAEDPVDRGGRAAALEVAERAGAGFLAGGFLEFRGDPLADAAEADFAAAVRVDGDDLAVRHVGTFGDDDQRAVVALRRRGD